MTTHNRIFHQVTVAGLVFEAIISADGPSLLCRASGAVEFGVSGLRRFHPEPQIMPDRRHDPRVDWWVVKCRDEVRIDLPGFSMADVQRLSGEFGLVILNDRDPLSSDRTRSHCFFASPAWNALRRWATKHPRIALANAHRDSYLPGWCERALAEAKVLST